eukprot:TRINITY_DN6132_c0_g2_i1.p1 TRINITY_DN6132_c0_g2~~TRINITY_DN6132_c0_g2_i1.p1  ORF type:complete len:415 (+),score=48.00 TRINITY_DN6132_c0_g2_i1:87-1247(+)
MDGILSLRTCSSLQGYALVHATSKNYSVFLRSSEENLEVLHELVGEEDIRIADQLAQMALVYEQQEEYQKAEECYYQSMKIKSKSSLVPFVVANALSNWKRVAGRSGVKIQHETFRLVGSITQWLSPNLNVDGEVSDDEIVPSELRPQDPLLMFNSRVQESTSSSKSKQINEVNDVEDSTQKPQTPVVPQLPLSIIEHPISHGTPGAPREHKHIEEQIQSKESTASSVAPFGQSTSSSSNVVSFQSDWKMGSPQSQSNSQNTYSNIDLSVKTSNVQETKSVESLFRSLSDATSQVSKNKTGLQPQIVKAQSLIDPSNTTQMIYEVPDRLLEQVDNTLHSVGMYEEGGENVTFERKLLKLTSCPSHFDQRKSFQNHLQHQRSDFRGP